MWRHWKENIIVDGGVWRFLGKAGDGDMDGGKRVSIYTRRSSKGKGKGRAVWRGGGGGDEGGRRRNGDRRDARRQQHQRSPPSVMGRLGKGLGNLLRYLSMRAMNIVEGKAGLWPKKPHLLFFSVHTHARTHIFRLA